MSLENGNHMLDYDEPEQKGAFNCDHCGIEIYESEDYYHINDELRLCEDCIEKTKKSAEADEFVE